MNFFIIKALNIIIKIDIKYKDAETIPAFSGKKYPANKAIIGIFALHGINGVRSIVSSRSFSFSIIRVPVMPGTLQPEPIINGIILLPLNPIFLKVLSNKNA